MKEIEIEDGFQMPIEDELGLELNDWFYANCDRPSRIVQISGRAEEVFTDDWDRPVDFCELYPIPFTEEIAELNGFQLGAYGDYELRFVLDGGKSSAFITLRFVEDCVITDIEKNTKRGVERIHSLIENVHEFQNALRCAKLKSFANNFKVK